MNRKTMRTKPQRRAKAKSQSAGVEQALDELNQLSPDGAKARRLISLLQQWLRDESGYDEQTWPKLKKALNEQRTRVGARRLFDA